MILQQIWYDTSKPFETVYIGIRCYSEFAWMFGMQIEHIGCDSLMCCFELSRINNRATLYHIFGPKKHLWFNSSTNCNCLFFFPSYFSSLITKDFLSSEKPLKLIRFMIYNVLLFLGDPLRRLPFLLIIKYSIFLKTKFYFLGKKGSVGNKPEKGDHLQQGQWSMGMEYCWMVMYTKSIHP